MIHSDQPYKKEKLQLNNTLVDIILLEAEDDWIPLDTLLWHVRKNVKSEEKDFQMMVINVLRFLLTENLMEIGHLVEEGFEAWTDPIDEIVKRVIMSCMQVDWEPLGSLYWLSLTSKGLQRIQVQKN